MKRSGLIAASVLLAAGLVTLPGRAQDKPTPAPTPVPGPSELAPEKKVAAVGGPVQIKVGDTASFRFGVLLQGQADWQELASGSYAQNLFLRRTRFLVAGQVTKEVFFFFQTENSRLGAVNAAGSKVISSGFQVLDAVAEWRIAKEFNLWGGLIYVPTSREALKSSSSEFMMDTSAWAYTATTALTGTGGRDTGFMARGYFLNDRLEYRLGAFQGLRDSASRNPFRTVARLQYNFLDTEVYTLPAYVSSNFGKKKILALGAAYDAQLDYQGFTADVFADIPVGFGSVVGTATYHHLDGGTTLKSLPKQDLYHIDAGLYFKGAKIGPWGRYEHKNVSADSTKNEDRYLLGLNYYPYGNNLNLKFGWTTVKPDTGKSLNEYTLQLQVGYF